MASASVAEAIVMALHKRLKERKTGEMQLSLLNVLFDSAAQ